MKRLQGIQKYLNGDKDVSSPPVNAVNKEENPQQKLVLIFKAILFPMFPKNTKYFQDAIHKFYSKAFKAFDAVTKTTGWFLG